MCPRPFVVFALLVSLSIGCVGTRSCPDDQRYINGACRPVDLDGGNDAADAADAGPCGLCPTETPICDESQTTATCVACVGNGDCSEARSICLDNACVQCTVSDESACGANVCDPVTNTCTDRVRASKGLCGECLADSECIAGASCVPMNFQGTPRDGGFCLQRADGVCTGSFRVLLTSRTSLSGAATGMLCGIVEALTTCEAVLDHEEAASCTGDEGCGAAGLDDGVCLTSGSICSYPCTGGGECRPVGYQCRAEAPRVCTGL